MEVRLIRGRMWIQMVVLERALKIENSILMCRDKSKKKEFLELQAPGVREMEWSQVTISWLSV